MTRFKVLTVDQMLEWESGRGGEGEQNPAVSPTRLVPLTPSSFEKLFVLSRDKSLALGKQET
jgi:hypothetical protein